MPGSCVSESSHRPSSRAPKRRARSRTWVALSSADTYSAGGSADAGAAATCNASVDLPMPGSPPMRVTDPETSPPPSTRSSSDRPVGTGCPLWPPPL